MCLCVYIFTFFYLKNLIDKKIKMSNFCILETVPLVLPGPNVIKPFTSVIKDVCKKLVFVPGKPSLMFAISLLRIGNGIKLPFFIDIHFTD